MSDADLKPREAAIPRMRALKLATQTTHQTVDDAIMAANPFADLDRYAGFLRMQLALHSDVAALYQDHALAQIVPDLAERLRLRQVQQDLADLGLSADPQPAYFDAASTWSLPQALGWLYVVEGSNLGAAVLLKLARKLDLSAEFGARHLAPADGGRGRHWKQFTAALEAVQMTPENEDQMQSSAKEAFARVHHWIRLYL